MPINPRDRTQDLLFSRGLAGTVASFQTDEILEAPAV